MLVIGLLLASLGTYEGLSLIELQKAKDAADRREQLRRAEVVKEWSASPSLLLKHKGENNGEGKNVHN